MTLFKLYCPDFFTRLIIQLKCFYGSQTMKQGKINSVTEQRVQIQRPSTQFSLASTHYMKRDTPRTQIHDTPRPNDLRIKIAQ